MQAYEGYIEKGLIFPSMPLAGIQERRRVIITVLDEPAQKKPDTWADIKTLIAEMDEKPRIEDFPRCRLDRKLINFEEV